MRQEEHTLIEIQIDNLTVQFSDGCLPDNYSNIVSSAKLVNEFDLKSSEGRVFFLSVWDQASSRAQSTIVVSQRYKWIGIPPAALIIPEEMRMFVGAGERLLCYDLSAPKQLWEEYTSGFWNWERHRDFVVMSAEMEFAVWSIAGGLLWSTPAEPPHSYKFDDGCIIIDDDGSRRAFRLGDGSASR